MSPPDVSKDHADAIGELVVRMTRIESIVVDLLAIFMDCNILNAVVAFYPMNFSAKMDTLKALYSLSLSDDERKTDPGLAILNTVSKLGDFRNSMVHAYWTIDGAGQTTAVRFPSRGGKFERKRRSVSAEQIREKAELARGAEITLRGLRDHLHRQREQASVQS